MRLAWLPNAITIARMALAVPLALSILGGHYGPALVVALVAGGSDAVDGWLAKRFRWESWLGGILDPLADKLMLVAAFVALTIEEATPLWLFLLVAGRDVVIVAGATAYHYLVGRLEAKPTRISKLTTVVQIVYVLALLAHLTPALELPGGLVAALLVATAVLTVASGLDYVVRWGLEARRKVRAARLARPG